MVQLWFSFAVRVATVGLAAAMVYHTGFWSYGSFAAGITPSSRFQPPRQAISFCCVYHDMPGCMSHRLSCLYIATCF